MMCSGNPQVRQALAKFKEEAMATNKPAGDGHRNGAVKDRTQLKTKIMSEAYFTKREGNTGQFLDQKADGRKFKGVRKES
jgi:hypothetical protein